MSDVIFRHRDMKNIRTDPQIRCIEIEEWYTKKLFKVKKIVAVS